MAKPAPGHAHDIPALNVLFGISAIALFLTTIWLVWDDYSREWKRYQREFYELERQTTREQIQEAEGEVDQRELERVESDLAAANQELEARQADIRELEEQFEALDNQWTLADVRERELKAVYDSKKFYHEEGESAPLGKAVSDEEFRALEGEFIGAREARLAIEYDRTQVQRSLRELRARVTELNSQKEALTQEATLLRRKLDSIARNFPNTFRNLPVVDFIDPSIEIRQVLVANVTEELNFTQVPRIDRCQTCHLGIDNLDYADAPQPFRTHPDLDLYVAPESKHPRDSFGCTSCHEGRGRATTFVGVNHTPQTEEQQHEWETRYGWKEDHYWDKPMYPNGFAEAGCLKCHADQVLLPGAEKFNESRNLYETAGCWGCHNTEGFEDRRKVGPNLGHIVAKTTPEWAARWVKDPKSFKKSTYMPRFWNLDNNLDSDIGARNRTEVAAIVAYVFDKAKPLSYTPVPAGDPDRGRNLIESAGCLGCHITDETAFDIAENAENTSVDWYRTKGPSLAGVGSKVKREFLFNWVKNPRHYWEETFMPDLRLTDREAADITAYLMSLRNEGFEQLPVPEVESAALDEITLEFLRSGLPLAQAEERISQMSTEEKTLYSGERLILRYGCFGCHDIEGFENAQKIGVDLSTWGSKMVTRLDFGYVDIEHTRKAWLEQKLRAPRSYDEGKVKSPPEKLRMGYFDFTEEEIDAIVRRVLSQVREELPRVAVKNLSANEAYGARARRLIHEYNCRGCHLVDGFGGGIYQTIEDSGFRPPNLNTQGARTQADWLFQFLKAPTEVRFWLNARMPTFHFSDDEANTLVQGFMAMEGTQPFETAEEQQPDPELLRTGDRLLVRLQCERCHIAAAAGTMEASQLAPSFRLSRERLREEWVVNWMRDPQAITPGTQMPQFWPVDDAGNRVTPLPDVLGGDAEAQMRAVAAYIMHYTR
ncbi:MAG TPA: c-type cytochrome [Vicinamibacteria bacterium]|nr:c-type cytochrome [Vicinamibacteria bacterium]